MCEEIGQGASGKVFKAIQKNTNVIMAIKVFIDLENSHIMALKEIFAFSLCKHKNIVRLFEIYRCSNLIFLIMEYVPYTLYNFVKNNCFIKKLITEVFHAVKYLHSKRIVHGDLKLENILVTKNFQVKISDFDMCIPMKQNNLFKSDEYTINKNNGCALEKKFSDTVQTDFSDIGVIIFEMFTGISFEKAIQEILILNFNGEFTKNPKNMLPFYTKYLQDEKLVDLIMYCLYDPQSDDRFSQIFKKLRECTILNYSD